MSFLCFLRFFGFAGRIDYNPYVRRPCFSAAGLSIELGQAQDAVGCILLEQSDVKNSSQDSLFSRQKPTVNRWAFSFPEL